MVVWFWSNHEPWSNGLSTSLRRPWTHLVSCFQVDQYTLRFLVLVSSVILKVCSANHWWYANPYLNQYFVLRGPPNYSKWSAYRKSLETNVKSTVCLKTATQLFGGGRQNRIRTYQPLPTFLFSKFFLFSFDFSLLAFFLGC